MKKTIVQAVLVGALFAAVASCATTGGAAGGRGGLELGAEITGLEWWIGTYDDHENQGSSTITMVENGEGSYTFSGEITNQYEYGFAGVVIHEEPNSPLVDATKAALQTAYGISFRIKGDGARYAFKVSTSDITDYCDYETSFSTTKDEEITVTIPFNTLVQPTWGQYKAFNQKLAYQMQFQTTNNGRPGRFEFTISEIKLHEK